MEDAEMARYLAIENQRDDARASAHRPNDSRGVWIDVTGVVTPDDLGQQTSTTRPYAFIIPTRRGILYPFRP
jgi:hypothetical protein